VPPTPPRKTTRKGQPPPFSRPAPPKKDPNEPVLVVRHRRARASEVAPAKSLTVLYEDADILAVDKPSGINVASEIEDETSLQVLASSYLAGKGEGTALIGARARMVQRLDREASGVVLFAKTPRAQSVLARDWEAGRVERVYLAIVSGLPEMETGVIDAPIGRDPSHKNLRSLGGLDAKPARTAICRLEVFAGGAFCLVEARPLTCQTQQVRVHLASIGCPLAVDPLYGDRSAPRPPVISRLTLHASTLVVPAPRDRKMRTAQSPLPADFSKALEELRAMKKAPAASAVTPPVLPRQRRRKISLIS
jgi:23S rRNA pseudouridine1911/1915/1917 synthase